MFPQRWQNKTVVIAASGPSLSLATSAIESLCKEGRVPLIAVNTTYRMFSDADVLYAGDFLWWKTHHAEVAKTFRGEKWTQDHTAAERYKLNRIKGINKSGLGTQYLHINGNSGFQAINLAYLFGSRKIVLVGFDMKLGPKGEKHWHGDHPSPLMQGMTFGEWMHKGATLAKDLLAAKCDVVNCSAESAMTCFRRGDLEKELQ